MKFSESEFEGEFTLLAEVLPHRQTLSPNAMEVYFAAIAAKLTAAEWREAVNFAVAECEWFPTVKQLIDFGMRDRVTEPLRLAPAEDVHPSQYGYGCSNAQEHAEWLKARARCAEYVKRVNDPNSAENIQRKKEQLERIRAVAMTLPSNRGKAVPMGNEGSAGFSGMGNAMDFMGF